MPIAIPFVSRVLTGPMLDRPTRLRRVAVVLELSKKAKDRLEWMLWYEAHDQNATVTARHFGISRKCFHAWKGRFDESNLRTLEEASRAPKKRRTRMITPDQEQNVIALRKEFPRYGKDKLALRYQERFSDTVSAWSIGRVISERQLFVHPQKNRRTQRKRLSAEKKKRIQELKVKPFFGFLLCLDTVSVSVAGMKRTIFTAVDKHAKLAFAWMYRSKAGPNGKDFLLKLHHLLDGQITHLGHDNGSEFKGQFATTAAELGIPQYHSRVRTPKDNPDNERFNRTMREEFIDLGHLTSDIDRFNRNLTDWLVEYNAHRPHHTLGNVSPMYFIQHKPEVLPMWSASTVS